MAKYIKATGEVSDCLPENGMAFTLKELQLLVGGWIELVTIHTDHGKMALVINEEGAICNPPLPLNPTATSMYHDVGGPKNWPIRGDVLLGAWGELGEDE